jgi:DNA-binding MarR family transcriptional regulator
VNRFSKKLEAAKRAATLHLLFKCSRLLNERAIASLPPSPPEVQPRPAHLSLFPHIELDGGTRVSDLAEKLGITRQAVGQLVDDLERMGAVERLPDLEDGRAKRVAFTSAGRRSMLDGLNHLKSLEGELSEVLGEPLLRSFRKALLLLHDHLDPPQATRCGK